MLHGKGQQALSFFSIPQTPSCFFFEKSEKKFADMIFVCTFAVY